MRMTAREVFEKGTEVFNAHDIDAFAELLADDVIVRAPGGMTGRGKAACLDFFGSWLDAFPDAHVQVNGIHVSDDFVIKNAAVHWDARRGLPDPGW